MGSGRILFLGVFFVRVLFAEVALVGVIAFRVVVKPAFLLLAAGRADEARDAFARAAQADPDGETDAADRLDELDGIEFDDLEDDDLEDDDLDLDANDLHDIDAEADKPEEGGLDADADGDDLGQRDLDEGHADEEGPTASHPG